jgi:ABC-type sugar transport system substrate-binding protein
VRSTLVVVVACLLALPFALAACGSSSSSKEGGKKQLEDVAVAMYARDNPFFAQVVSGIHYEAKRKGVKVSVSWAENDPGQEVTNIQNLITRQPDGLIISPIDAHALIPPVQQAKKAGIPVVIVTDDIAQEGQQYQLTSMSSDYTNTGSIKAQYIADKLHGKGKVAVLHLIRGLAFTEAQWAGAKQVFDKYPGIKIVAEKYAGGAASDLGLNAAENFLTAHRDLDAIYVDNDPLAMGVIQAVKQRGLNKKVVIVGADGTPDAIKAVQAGDLGLTIDFCGFDEGRRALSALWTYVVNGKVDKQKPPQQTITTDNVAEKAPKLEHGCHAP